MVVVQIAKILYMEQVTKMGYVVIFLFNNVEMVVVVVVH